MRKFIAVAFLISFSATASGTVINTLGGVKYEWLGFAATKGMSRDQVELELANPNSPLYGYEYPSRALVERLLLSYASFDGLNGYHGAPDVLSGMQAFFDDFGFISSNTGDGINAIFDTVDGYRVKWDRYERFTALFGLEDECLGPDTSCFCTTSLQYDAQGNVSMVDQYDTYGWDATRTVTTNHYPDDLISERWASFLVRVISTVEVDVDPWGEENIIRPESTASVVVAVLGSNTATGDERDFDVQQINPGTLKFGVGEAPNIAVNPLYGDYNDDANTDAAFVFQTQDTGIICDDTEVSLSGQTFSGAAFEGIDLIVTTECESTGCHP